MNNRKLSRKDAMDQLIICRQRLAEALHLFTLWDDIRKKKITLILNPTETPEDYLETLRTAFLGWLASLIDKTRDAINVFDVWVALFPAEQGEIRRVWQENKAAFELLRDFRNTTGFHGNKSLGEHLRVRKQVLGSKPIEKASQDFFGLAIRMHRIEHASPDFQDTAKARFSELGIDPAGFLRRFEY
jgi:hypothetical protein